MTLEEYADKALATLGGQHAYGQIDPTTMAQVLGLCGESGEVAEKFKKLIRDQLQAQNDRIDGKLPNTHSYNWKYTKKVTIPKN